MLEKLDRIALKFLRIAVVLAVSVVLFQAVNSISDGISTVLGQQAHAQELTADTSTSEIQTPEPGVFGEVMKEADETIPTGLLKILTTIFLVARLVRKFVSDTLGVEPESGTWVYYAFVLIDWLALHLPVVDTVTMKSNREGQSCL